MGANLLQQRQPRRHVVGINPGNLRDVEERRNYLKRGWMRQEANDAIVAVVAE